jgi:glucans biosynthesis protein
LSDNPVHPRRDPERLNAAPRCGARTRAGGSCRAPAVKGKRRCRMHGGAAGSGAPRGERNGNFKTGRYAQETKAMLRAAKALMRGARQTIKSA